MRVLLHICCGPCAIMPIRHLVAQGHEVAGFFFNPNIQPLTEYLRRREGALQTTTAHGIPLLFPSNAPEYDIATWCREAYAFPEGRCAYCRASRFNMAASMAHALGFDAFTSSLLYSRHQNHEGMRTAGEAAANKCQALFLYQDFRPFWQEGIAMSKELGVYRQQYCGCVFSEEERYARDLAKVTKSTP